MFNRSAFRVIGFILLIPSVIAGLSPWLSTSTELFSTWSNFTLVIAGHELMSYDSISGAMSASPLVWIGAAAGELMIIGAHLMRPSRKTRYTLSLN